MPLSQDINEFQEVLNTISSSNGIITNSNNHTLILSPSTNKYISIDSKNMSMTNQGVNSFIALLFLSDGNTEILLEQVRISPRDTWILDKKFIIKSDNKNLIIKFEEASSVNLHWNIVYNTINTES